MSVDKQDERPSASPRELRRRRLRRLRAIRRWASRGFLVLAALLAAGVYLVLQTSRGQQAALDAAIERVAGVFSGDLTIGAVRSRTLLAGASLDDVMLTDETGRRVLSADSVVVRYLPTGLVSGPLRFRSVIFWGLDFEISTLAEGEPLNLSRILVPGEPSPDSASTRVELMFGQVGVRDGRISVLSPAANGRRAGAPGVIAGPAGPLQRIGLDGMDLDLEDAVLSVDGGVTFRSDLASLAMGLSLPGGEEPMVLREAFGRLTFDLERGLSITEGAFRLPETLGRGTVELGPVSGATGWALRGDFDVTEWGSLADLRWSDARIPDGTFRGRALVTTVDDVRLDLDGVDIRLSDTNLALDGEVVFGDVLATRDLVVVASPLVLSRLDPWVEAPLPVDGWLSGRAVLSGTAENLQSQGRVTFVPVGYGGRPTTADFSGGMHLGPDPGWADFTARLDPLNYQLVEALSPRLTFGGSGAANLQLDGRFRQGTRIVADFEHETGDVPESRLHVRGTVTSADAGWNLDLSGDVMPLALGVTRAFAPGLELRGEVRGPVTARGPLADLALTADLVGDGGRLAVDGRMNVTDPASRYTVDFVADELSLAHYTGRLPDPTLWRGTLSMDGSGLDLDALQGTGSLRLRPSRIGGLMLDTATVELRAEDGVLHWESLDGVVAGIRFEGTGELGLGSGTSGDASLLFHTESLVGLRPLFMGDSIIVGDELTSLERELLRLDGIDPDTLPTSDDVRLEGAVRGVADLSGRLSDLAVDLRMSLVGGAYATHRVDSLEVGFVVDGLPGLGGSWRADVDAHGLLWEGRAIERVAGSGTMRDRAGSGEIRLSRRAGEAYFLAGDFQLDSVGGEAYVTELTAALGDQNWTLTRPASLAWTANALMVDTLEVYREGDDPMRLLAAGTLAGGGESDFRLDVEGLHLERAGAMIRNEPLDIEGHMDLRIHVRGPAEMPLIDAELEVLDPRFRNIELARLSATAQYRERVAALSVDAWQGERLALTASGTVPMDLALTSVDTRHLDSSMDVSISADSLDAALALAYFATLEDVVGVVSADIHLGGTTRDPIPSGAARLESAAWSIEALGVRHRDVSGTLELREDQTVSVDLATRGTGTSTVSGTIGLSPLSDPSLDLNVGFERFRAMQRRDIEGIVSGAFTLGGTYQRPLAEGTLTVDEGTLQVDEFARAAGVVDLTDPRLFGQGLAVDTTVFMSQPILAEVRNPFLDNLRLNVELLVPRNTWLRSTDMNVEMGGDLLVRYDRSAGDLVLIGELQALRGTYLVLGRTFEVDEGTVSFIGRPGINPSLNITALSRFRSSEGEPVQIMATVEGTLVQPRVTLTSEDGELSQSDLISYLVFNQSAAELGRARQSFLTGQMNAGAGGALTTAATGGVTYLAGAFLGQSGAAVAQNLSLDYLAVSAGPASATTLGGLRSTQVEVGRYLSEDVFAVVIFRPVAEEGSRIGGVRVEWALTNSYNLEAFVEDYLLRSGGSFLGLRELGGDQFLYGVLLLREWGYNE